MNEQEKTPMIVLHGFGVSSRWLDRYRETFSGNYNVITPEMAYSPEGDEMSGASVDSWADAILESYSQLFNKETVLVGESLGCAVALSLASRTLVSRLILVTPFVEFRVNLSDIFSLLFLPTKYVAKIRAEKSFKNFPETKEALISMTGSLSKSKMIRAIQGQRNFQWRDYTVPSSCKTQIIGGEFDRLAPPKLIDELSDKTNARTSIIEKSGHQVPTKKWEAVKSIIESFL
ncbi:MAG TPA: alpha/beta hydrolase [Caldisericia bacterium]|nr:alpha/beta hydrolase [Caldisericia bacterium]HPF48350.1 alpha/beta hydrolase [Caldisericia bacterium]HPI83471.1 alpha/beta hydrolase [Caldisericia bacterium]HPQ92803.1 alpha/beta hydrolase [Caldisericia bacterium]HRV74099.1 alpha/beta hydrolase [Caldisericia bacterium]